MYKAAATLEVGVFLWSNTGDDPNAGCTAVVVVWLALFLTDYWQAVLYPVLSLVLSVLIIFWWLDDPPASPVGILAVPLTVALVLLFLILFFREAEWS